MIKAGPHILEVPEGETSAEIEINLDGMIVGVGLVYITQGSVDVEITEQNENEPDQKILSLSGNTDGWFPPTDSIYDTDGAQIENQYTIGIPVYGQVLISLSNAEAGDIVYITLKLI